MQAAPGSGRFPLFVVDAFTKAPFRGNPAAVVFLEDDSELDDPCKQSIAAEMRHSETAFVSKQNAHDEFDNASCFNLRWFTPKNEVALCGHATLATAAAIFGEWENPSQDLQFHTKSGVLKASKEPDDAILLDLPARTSVTVEEANYRSLLEAVLGDVPVAELRYCAEEKKLVVRLHDCCTRSQLEALKPSSAEMLHAENDDRVRGVAVTVRGSDGDYDFLSRYFSPWNGIPEDPVTGSAHTVLGPYWADVFGKEELKAHQASARGGDLNIRVPAGGHRLQIGGHARVILRGELLI
uniref:Phenazine biosynthesis-like domain-containing protein n=1 Tax=Amblyomma triste TaxID=251400 RepID=A0A023GFE6_AMBTT